MSLCLIYWPSADKDLLSHLRHLLLAGTEKVGFTSVSSFWNLNVKWNHFFSVAKVECCFGRCSYLLPRGTKQGMLEMDCRSLGGNNLSGLLPDLHIFHSLRKLWVSHPGNLFRLLIFIITFLMFPISTKWGEEPTLAWTSLNSILSLSGDPPQWKQVHFLLFVFCHGGLPGTWVTINLEDGFLITLVDSISSLC